MSSVDDHIAETLAKLREENLMRKTTTIEKVDGPFVTIEGKRYLCFCSNDYLGLAQHPRLVEAAVDAAREYGWGTGASRLLSGTTKWHRALEEKLARFKGYESATLFISGYMANMGLVSTLADERTFVAADELNHASMIDGCRLCKGKVAVYKHRDIDSAADVLSEGRGFARRLLITDTVFSMDGDVAPLERLLEVAADYDAEMIVDDAHGFGVFGENGRGVPEHLKVEDRIKICSATMSKAAGSSGGFIAGSGELAEMLVSRARSFIFTTAFPPALCAASMAGIELLALGKDLRRRLWENVKRFRDEVVRMGFDTGNSEAAIIPIVIGSNEKTLRAAKILWEAGIFTPAIRPPTVPEGMSRLRFSITAMHEPAHIDQAIAAMQSIRAAV